MAWVLDLDGVVWLGDQPIPGAADAVRKLQATGEDVLFVTNMSGRTRGLPRKSREGVELVAARQPPRCCEGWHRT